MIDTADHIPDAGKMVTDTARLDWLEANSDIRAGVFVQTEPGLRSAGRYIRAAIDARIGAGADFQCRTHW